MPSADAILDAAGRIANDWRSLAVFWHIYFGALAMLIVRYRQLSTRVVASALAIPLASVSAMAWSTGNPFNGSVFAGLALGLAAIARRVPDCAIRFGTRSAAGVSVVAFGWAYPHFLEGSHWAMYLVAAPLGLLPCPTLAAVIGVTIALGGLNSSLWRVTLGLAGLAYGVIGVIGLGVTLDLGLVAGAIVLLLGQLGQIVVSRRERRSLLAPSLTDG